MAYGTIRADIIEGTNVAIDLSVAGQYDFSGDLLPDVDLSRDLGSASLRWQNVYFDNIFVYGEVQGDIIPSADSTYDLGSPTLRFSSVFANTYSGGGTFSGNILPDADNTHDLGSPSLRWANIYTGDLHLANDRGDWTVVEEAEYLSLKNNKTGKTFRLLMEEVDS